MLSEIKALVVVLTLALTVFALAKPYCLQFTAPEDYARRRNVWVILTVGAFLLPNIWLYALLAFPLVFWAGRADRHPTAVYLLLMLVVPPVSIPIPLFLVNQLFELSPTRILAITLLVPAVARILRSGEHRRPGLVKVDLAVLAFLGLQLAAYLPYESFTNTMRRTTLFLLDTYLLYFVFSRATASKTALRDSLAAFCLACAVLVPVVVFEAVKGWLLYVEIPGRWGQPNTFSWLMREGVLRAQGPAGHSLTMGYLFATAFGCWLYIGGLFNRRVLWVVGLGFWAGLIAAYSRAPWIVAATIFFVYLVLSPLGRRHLVGSIFGAAAALGALSMTSLGARLLSALPFVGTVDTANVDYRQQLAEVSWRLIKENPFFGDPFAARYMEDLRQGQGIIDLVNTYAWIGVFYGLIGVAVFVAAYLIPMARTAASMLAVRAVDPDTANLGAVLIGCVIGALLMMATASFGNGFETVCWVLAGMCSAYPAVVLAARGSPLAAPAASPAEPYHLSAAQRPVR